MVAKKISDETIIAEWETLGPSGIARKHGMALRGIMDRRLTIQGKYGIVLKCNRSPLTLPRVEYPGELHLEIKTGVVISASDFHYWPGDPCVMHRAIVYLCKKLKPQAFIANGDVVDGATISRHPRIGWEQRPTWKQERETAQDRMHEIASACPRGCHKMWPLGNHDERFDTLQANRTPETEGATDTLQDSFPAWQHCMATWINGEQIVFMHRYRGGTHATYNNVLHAGTSIVTGHDHAANIRMHDDFRRHTRYGVNTGMVADREGKQFVYTRATPKNWREAAGVFTFNNGFLMQPELVLKVDENTVQFRGDLITV